MSSEQIMSTLPALDPAGEGYQEAFAAYLAHSDEAAVTRPRLDRIVASLPERLEFIDVGAGFGRTVRWFVDSFAHVVAIEPNLELHHRITLAAPDAEVLGGSILTAQPRLPADLVLCSHILYYVPRQDWQACLNRMASWLSEEGELVVLLQNPDSDLMRLLHRFTGRRFDLAELLPATRDSGWSVVLDTVPSILAAPDLDTALMIFRFFLSGITSVPTDERRPARTRAELTRQLDRHRLDDGGYRMSCTQDVLRLRRR
ncbi:MULTISPECIES: class I SAM-dependent methyltransferase [Actinoalloteichus]|uniref:Methyltransferase domain n=1 Tax=Actinoalloteichus fjordicus TaxID=1612552 RepID=A0AAC9LIE3_9PSEU|nr:MULTISPECIES: class I SAM-dependent methyltransferase [Actinoalloteichus]APU16930.1 Methyltransferase domain [Actinoalloteichus fjordicus]APU23010.1 Methyltransferase domain [Actinoalloteichus sp. GBA129-24]